VNDSVVPSTFTTAVAVRPANVIASSGGPPVSTTGRLITPGDAWIISRQPGWIVTDVSVPQSGGL